MPHLRDCVRNRFTLQETDAYLRQLGYRGSFGEVRYKDLEIPFCFIQGFREAIRSLDAEYLLSLITNPQVTPHPGLKCFVGRLKQNIDVILAACRFEESNGYVEENVNRLKMLKRLIFGRIGFH